MIPLTRKLIWLSISLFSASWLLGSTPESCLLFSLTSQQTARLGIVNTTNHSLSLDITNLNGETFFSKSIGSNQNFFQVLDLTQMPGGEYTVKLSGLDNSIEKKFVITNASIQILEKVVETPPTFLLMEDRTLVISYINSQKNTINILLESDGDTIFEEKGIIDLALSKRYSLKRLPSGRYMVRLSSGSKTYSYPLVLK